jgi:hypothetical protein
MAPAAPSNLAASAVVQTPTSALVTLTWTDNANNETSFTVQRATDAAFTTGVANATVAANATTRLDLRPRGVLYFYRVRAFSTITGTTSAWSNVVSLTTP